MQELNRAPLTRDIAQSILFSSAVRSHLKRSWCETVIQLSRNIRQRFCCLKLQGYVARGRSAELIVTQAFYNTTDINKKLVALCAYRIDFLEMIFATRASVYCSNRVPTRY